MPLFALFAALICVVALVLDVIAADWTWAIIMAGCLVFLFVASKS